MAAVRGLCFHHRADAPYDVTPTTLGHPRVDQPHWPFRPPAHRADAYRRAPFPLPRSVVVLALLAVHGYCVAERASPIVRAIASRLGITRDSNCGSTEARLSLAGRPTQLAPQPRPVPSGAADWQIGDHCAGDLPHCTTRSGGSPHRDYNRCLPTNTAARILSPNFDHFSEFWRLARS